MDCSAGRAGLPIVLALLAALLGRADARMTDYPIPFRADRRLLVTGNSLPIHADAASQGKLLFIVLCGATVVLFIVFVALLALLISLHYRAARSAAPAETAKKLPLRAIWRATSSLGVAQQVGEGDFGRAYLGEHRGEAWLVVVSTSDNIDIIKAFRREVDTLGPVSHPSLVRLVGWAEEASSFAASGGANANRGFDALATSGAAGAAAAAAGAAAAAAGAVGSDVAGGGGGTLLEYLLQQHQWQLQQQQTGGAMGGESLMVWQSPGLPVLRAAGGHSTQPGGSTAPPALLRGPSFGALVSHPPLCLYPTCYRPHPPDAALSLSFERRVDIAHSLAAGLHHLHCCVDPPIVHRQVNSGNVLLQPRWPYARLANVGEVKGLPYAPTINGRRNRAAYIDPEYFIALRASAASDVYSFGIILLELLTGQPAEQIDPATGRRAYLNTPALTALIRAHHLPPLLDPALPFPPTPAPSALQALASLAADCTVRYAKQRPDASAVLLQMEGIREAVQNGLAVQGRAGDHLSLSIPGSVAEAEARGRFGSRGGELVGGSGREWGSAGELSGAQGSVGWSAGERSLGGGGSERERGGELARERGGSGRSHGGSDRERGSGTSGGGSFLDGSSAYLYGEQPRGIVSSSSYPQVLSSLAHQPPSPHPPASPHTPFKRHSLPRTHTAPVSPSLLPTLPLFEAPHFSFHALQQATEGFAPHRVHRQAHLGEVYLGTIKTVGEVMVVRQMAPGAGEGGSTGGGGSFGRDKRGVGGRSGELGRGGEWGTGEEARERERERERDMWVSRTIAEAHALRRVVHRNLVTLLGFTVTTDQCLLTYTHTDAPDLFHSLHLPGEACGKVRHVARASVAGTHGVAGEGACGACRGGGAAAAARVLAPPHPARRTRLTQRAAAPRPTPPGKFLCLAAKPPKQVRSLRRVSRLSLPIPSAHPTLSLSPARHYSPIPPLSHSATSKSPHSPIPPLSHSATSKFPPLSHSPTLPFPHSPVPPSPAASCSTLECHTSQRLATTTSPFSPTAKRKRPPFSPTAKRKRPPFSPTAKRKRPPFSPTAKHKRPPFSPTAKHKRPPFSPTAKHKRPPFSPTAKHKRPPFSPTAKHKRPPFSPTAKHKRPPFSPTAKHKRPPFSPTAKHKRPPFSPTAKHKRPPFSPTAKHKRPPFSPTAKHKRPPFSPTAKHKRPPFSPTAKHKRPPFSPTAKHKRPLFSPTAKHKRPPFSPTAKHKRPPFSPTAKHKRPPFSPTAKHKRPPFSPTAKHKRPPFSPTAKHKRPPFSPTAKHKRPPFSPTAKHKRPPFSPTAKHKRPPFSPTAKHKRPPFSPTAKHKRPPFSPTAKHKRPPFSPTAKHKRPPFSPTAKHKRPPFSPTAKHKRPPFSPTAKHKRPPFSPTAKHKRPPFSPTAKHKRPPFSPTAKHKRPPFSPTAKHKRPPFSPTAKHKRPPFSPTAKHKRPSSLLLLSPFPFHSLSSYPPSHSLVAAPFSPPTRCWDIISECATTGETDKSVRAPSQTLCPLSLVPRFPLCPLSLVPAFPCARFPLCPAFPCAPLSSPNPCKYIAPKYMAPECGTTGETDKTRGMRCLGTKPRPPRSLLPPRPLSFTPCSYMAPECGTTGETDKTRGMSYMAPECGTTGETDKTRGMRCLGTKPRPPRSLLPPRPLSFTPCSYMAPECGTTGETDKTRGMRCLGTKPRPPRSLLPPRPLSFTPCSYMAPECGTTGETDKTRGMSYMAPECGTTGETDKTRGMRCLVTKPRPPRSLLPPRPLSFTPCSYMAPECGTTGETDKTTDMYAYGVLLLELVSGKLPYDDDRDPVQLSDWARQQDWSSSESIKELVDPLLEGMYNEDEVLILASLAMRCINVDKRERPTVKEQRLRRKQQLDDGPGSALAEEAPRKAKKRAGGAAAAAEGAAQQPQPQLDTIPAQLPAQIPETPPSSATLLDPVPIDVPSASDQPSLSTSSALSASAVSPADSPADELAGLTQRVAKSVRDVRGYAKLNVSTATVQQVCEMVDHNLAPWTRIPQIRDGMGAAGMVAPSLVKTISQRARFMSCAGHVRVVDGSVYFRLGGFITIPHLFMSCAGHFMSCAGHVRVVDGSVYFRLGGFITVPYRVRRFLQTVQTIQINTPLTHSLEISKVIIGESSLHLSKSTSPPPPGPAFRSLFLHPNLLFSPPPTSFSSSFPFHPPSPPISQPPSLPSFSPNPPAPIFHPPPPSPPLTIPAASSRLPQPGSRRAVDFHNLAAVRAEFFVNTCDLPISYDSDVGGSRPVGFPFFSTRVVPGSVDVAIPDPLDLPDNMDLPENVEVREGVEMVGDGSGWVGSRPMRFPFFSTRVVPGSVDVAIPDPLDLPDNMDLPENVEVREWSAVGLACSVDAAIPDPFDLPDNMDLPANVEVGGLGRESGRGGAVGLGWRMIDAGVWVCSVDVPWEEKENRAVFRGTASSFPFEDSQNWRAHPLIRLHRTGGGRTPSSACTGGAFWGRMAEARPDLLDVKLIGWSRDIDGDVRKRMEADGVAMVGRPTLTADPPMSKFKYQIVSGLPSSHQTCAILARGEQSKYQIVSGLPSSHHTCAILARGEQPYVNFVPSSSPSPHHTTPTSPVPPSFTPSLLQVAIRQASPYAEFFTPLLKPYVNFIPANRHFDNLIEKLRWAQSHDNHVHHMVAAAKRAAKWACTRSGHTLYWAILLIKYSKNALQDPSTIKAPVKTLCQDPLDPALLEMAGLAAPSSPTSSPSLSLPDSWPPVCSRDNIDRSAQPKCVYYCQKGVIPGKSFVWVSAEALKAGGGAQSA
ncbi:unnamed protein product [Closterium sp. NIES-64]|nr:unnamed protein product [Closterium sp. NIES-64]